MEFVTGSAALPDASSPGVYGPGYVNTSVCYCLCSVKILLGVKMTDECSWQDLCASRFTRLEEKIDILVADKIKADIARGIFKVAIRYIPHALIAILAGFCGSLGHKFFSN